MRDILGPELTDLFNSILEFKEVPSSFRNAVITLLYKKNDPRFIKNWRPISLLNVDYKLFARVIARRFLASSQPSCRAICSRLSGMWRWAHSYYNVLVYHGVVCVNYEIVKLALVVLP